MGASRAALTGPRVRRGMLVLVALAVAVNLLLLWGLPHEPLVDGPALPWPLLALMFLLGDAVALRFELRRRTFVFHLTGVQILLGVALCPLPELLLARVAAALVSQVLERRGPMRVVGSACVHALEVLVVAGLLHLLTPGPPLAGPATWPAVPLALIGGMLAGYLLVNAFVATRTGVRELDPDTGRMLVPWTVCLVAESVVALLLLELLHEPAAAVALVALGAGFGLYHRSAMRLRGRYGQLQLLSHFTEALVGQARTEDVVMTVLDQSLEVLRADNAELLLLADDSGPARWVRQTPLGVIVVNEIGPDLDHPVLLLLSGCTTGRTIRSGTSDPLEREVLRAVGCRNAVVAPLQRGGRVAGALVVGERSDRSSEFSDHDGELAGSLAAAATVALDKGRLFDRARQEAAVREHQALHDALTGLPNGVLISRHLQEALLGGPVGVLLLDLDRFQDVNDSLGHDVGDRLLLTVATRLRIRLGPRFATAGGWLGRLGGDEFAIVLPGLSEDELLAEAEAVHAVFDVPFTLGDTVLDVRVSIGAAGRTHADDAGRLLQYAEIAMYDVKRRGGGVNAYLAGDEHTSRRRLALAGALRRAVEDGELGVEYQPKVDLATGRPVGVEALVRWTSPEYGVVPPDEFVPLAEQSGLVGPLTALVLDRALALAAHWDRIGRDLTVAVNVSPRGLADGTLIGDVPALLARHRVRPDRLILELTEGTVMTDPAASAEVLEQLAALGVGLSVDDFGTGYSSLAYLKRLPVHEVKIDRAFVMGMSRDGDDAAIVRSTVHLAHDLGLRVVAEGVEDAAAYACLQTLGCDVVQGYLLSRPLAAEGLDDWLDAWPGHGTALLAGPPAQRAPV